MNDTNFVKTKPYNLHFLIPKQVHLIFEKNTWNKSKIVKRYLRKMNDEDSIAADIHPILLKEFHLDAECNISFNTEEKLVLLNVCEIMGNVDLSRMVRAILIYHAFEGYKNDLP